MALNYVDLDFYRKRLLKPKALLMTILGRFYWIRKFYTTNYIKISNKLEKNTSDYHAENSSIFEGINRDLVNSSLNEDGLFIGLNLPEHYLNELVDIASVANFHKINEYNEYIISQKDLNNVAITKIINDPLLISIASQYFGGAKPLFIQSRLFWTFAKNVEDYTQEDYSQRSNLYFHYDLDDYSCLRFFFYLTDVDPLSGPHVCVRGSHAKKKLTHILSRSRVGCEDEEIINYYGSDKVVSVQGSAGLGFVEDSTCFHKATRPVCHDRLMFQITFAINSYLYD
jgi:hypothetical protein